MSQEKIYPVNADIVGRVLSLEQRVKGLSGRIAAIEARLSFSGERSDETALVEDFVAAAGHYDQTLTADNSTTGDQGLTAGQASRNPVSGTMGKTRPGFDLTGLVAGVILIGAGILLLTGNMEILKNPLAAIGCGILLIACAINRKLYK